MLKNLILSALSYLMVLQIAAQDIVKTDGGFIAPLGGQMYLSGTFGELRSNHFHAGVDIKTGGVEGKRVYAIADGYVSRIKVATGGYGKVVYVTHPNGYVSVYGHLQRFNDSLEAYVQRLQYVRESFEMEAYPGRDELPVKQGEVIAISGNTGGSSAPHLHFEIREDGSQHPLNPLLFEGIEVKDYYRPRILELALYPVDRNSRINGRNDTVHFTVGGWGEEHYLEGDPLIEVAGRVSFGIRTYDPMNDISNKNGVYTIDLLRNGERVYGLEMDRLSFATTRYLNSLIDYGYYKKTSDKLVRTQVDTNNRLFNYREVLTNGILNFADTTISRMKYIVRDAYGNTASLDFNIISQSAEMQSVEDTIPVQSPKGMFFPFGVENKVSSGNIRLEFPENCFYRSLWFDLDSVAAEADDLSVIYRVHNRFVPVQKYFELSIKPGGFPESSRDRLYIAYRDVNGGEWYIGGRWEGEWLTTSSRLLGDYTIKTDTIPPTIQPVNISDGKNVSGLAVIRIRISDKQTGIRNYRAEINGKWVLFEYEPKKNLLEYVPDSHLIKGENLLVLKVTDLLGNMSTYSATLIK